MYKLHTKCRICGSTELLPVLDLGVQPLANDFRKLHEPKQGMAPLELLVCWECELGQLSVVVDPTILYSNYAYSSSKSTTMRNHWDWLIEELRSRTPVESVVEIGSNDGAFLAHLKKKYPETQVLGVDPAIKFCDEAIERGVPTLRKLWDLQAADLARTRLRPDLVLARHVFAHMDDWKGAFAALDLLCGNHTVVAIEVPDARNMLVNAQFDQIYHEHLNFITDHSMKELTARTPFVIMDVLSAEIHGGSKVYLLTKDKSKESDCINKPQTRLEAWSKFADRSRERIENFGHLLGNPSFNDSRIVGYGAPAKSTVWIQAVKANEDDIECLVDHNPIKIGTVSPGTRIPIVPEDNFGLLDSKLAILFAWNYAREIKEKQKDWIKKGGVFIIP